MEHSGANGIVRLTSLSSGGGRLQIDAGVRDRGMVLANDVIFGSVNANRRHYEAGTRALAAADRSCLDRLVTHEVPLER